MNAPTIEQIDAAYKAAKNAAGDTNLFLISLAYGAWSTADGAIQSLQDHLLGGHLKAVDTVADYISQNVNTMVYISNAPCQSYHKAACVFALLVWAEIANTANKGIDKASLLEGFFVRRREESKIGLNGLFHLLADQAKPLPCGWVEENQDKFTAILCQQCEQSTQMGTAVLAGLEKEYNHVRRLLPESRPPDATGQKRLPLELDWLTLASVARGFDWATKQKKPDSKHVARLIDAGELTDNGKRGQERKVSRTSVVDYYKRNRLEWNEDAAMS